MPRVFFVVNYRITDCDWIYLMLDNMMKPIATLER